MNNYLIGEKLIHSYSKKIHNLFNDKDYFLMPLNEHEFDEFMKNKNFLGLNVTIPYKEKVLKYIDEFDEISNKTKVVNTIINNNGVLKGYNTDYYGFLNMCKNNNISFKNKKALILGSGGTSKTIKTCLIDEGIKEVYIVSRTKGKDKITYLEAENKFDVDYIINTTPCGMYPHIDDKLLINLDKFTSLKYCIDVIYNPFRTNFLLEAKKRGIKILSGLEMLVKQAYYSHKLFYPKRKSVNSRSVYRQIMLENLNLVLIGLPATGKTTISSKLASCLNLEHIDTDAEIEKNIHMSIKEFFNLYGEDKFREIEHDVINEVFKNKGKVISLGGGSLILEKNRNIIMRNSIIIFLNRDLSFIKENKRAYIDRPLLVDENSINKLYQERISTYKQCSDIEIDTNSTILNTINEILTKLM